jgi:hypothetical protein
MDFINKNNALKKSTYIKAEYEYDHKSATSSQFTNTFPIPLECTLKTIQKQQ